MQRLAQDHCLLHVSFPIVEPMAAPRSTATILFTLHLCSRLCGLFVFMPLLVTLTLHRSLWNEGPLCSWTLDLPLCWCTSLSVAGHRALCTSNGPVPQGCPRALPNQNPDRSRIRKPDYTHENVLPPSALQHPTPRSQLDFAFNYSQRQSLTFLP